MRKLWMLDAAIHLQDLRIPPGEILKEEFVHPLGITEYRLAKDISVPPRRINEIVRGKRA